MPRSMRLVFASSVAAVLTTTPVAAQDSTADPPPKAWKAITLAVAKDMTTFAPAYLFYASSQLDWNSSQPFFQYGWGEQNARFTRTGVSGTSPIGYEEGNKQIAIDALQILQKMVVNNVAARLVERRLVDRFPRHRKLVRVVSTIERIAVSSYMSYVVSSPHFSQWQANEQLSRRLGYN